jgi:hypothetical protein
MYFLFSDGYKLKFPGITADNTISHLKNVFWPNIFVGASFQILDIQQYACGLRPTKSIGSGGKSSNAGKLGPAAILNQNPNFETASNRAKVFGNEKGTPRNGIRMMKIKLLLLSAVIFLLLGWNTKDGVLFFFFAVHLFTLTIGVFLAKYDQKYHPARTLDPLSTSDSSQS